MSKANWQSGENRQSTNRVIDMHCDDPIVDELTVLTDCQFSIADCRCKTAFRPSLLRRDYLKYQCADTLNAMPPTLSPPNSFPVE
jgi:hypothetical protein